MDKIEFRAYIKTRALLGITAVDITNELKLVHGDLAPEYRTVAKWSALFKAGREDLADDPAQDDQLPRAPGQSSSSFD